MTEIFKIIYRVALDSLFPLSKAEKEVLSYSPEHAFTALSHVSSLHNLTIPPEYLDHLSAIFAYKDERVAKLIWNIKYKKSGKGLAIGAYALWRGLKAIPHKNFVLVPMPMTAKRRRERGYNQCEYLVDAVKKLDKENLFTVKMDLLVRTLHADRQTLKGREERMEDAKGIFKVNKAASTDLIIVVIDDVITTGSTMKEAFDTLRAAGFSEIYGLCLAH